MSEHVLGRTMAHTGDFHRKASVRGRTPRLGWPNAAGEAWIKALAWIGLVALLAFGGARHEPWFDEAQAWLIARDASPWDMVSRLGRYEGTPMLWHLLLWSLQRLGYPYSGLWLISSAFAAAGAWITLHRAPFPLWLRVGLIFAYFPAYQFAVVARSYSLDLVLFPFIAAAYASRLKRPGAYALLLGITANTNAFAFLFACVFATGLAWDLRSELLRGARRAWTAAVAFGVLGLLAAVQARPAPDVTYSGPPTILGWSKATILLKEAFFSRIDFLSSDPPSGMSHIAGFVLSLCLMSLVAALCQSARKLPLLAGGVVAFVLFSVLTYGSLWHAGMLFLFVVVMVWIAWDQRERMAAPVRTALTAGLALFVASSACETACAYARDYQSPYSSSVATARWIENFRTTHADARIAALGFGALNVQPFFPHNIFANYDVGPSKPAYYLWSRRIALKPHPTVADIRATLKRTQPDVALLPAQVPRLMPRYLAEARRDGYCTTARIDGDLIWKSIPVQSDAEWVLRPCGDVNSGASRGGGPQSTFQRP